MSLEYKINYSNGIPISITFEPDFTSSDGTYQPKLGQETLRVYKIPGWSYSRGVLTCNLDSSPNTDGLEAYAYEQFGKAQLQVTALMDKLQDWELQQTIWYEVNKP